MKNQFKSVSLLTICTGLFLLTNCSDNPATPNATNCGNDAEKVSTAAQAYVANPTKATCEAYKNTVKDFYKSCATFYTGAAKDALDDFIAEPCPN